MDAAWHAAARARAQRLGLDPRYLRRLRWLSKAQAVRRVGASLPGNVRYVLLDPEPDNFTYEIGNETELGAWVDFICGCGLQRARELIAEPHTDAVLSTRLHTATAAHRLWSKPAPPFGKRRGWYALARVLGPELIVETGVHDGLGSLLLLRALERNADEGRPGRLVSFDINPDCGWLVGSHPHWELQIGATQPALARALEHAPPVGLFVHDSLHTYENERYELRTAAAHLAPSGVLISDNAHATHAMVHTCEEFSLGIAEFAERPVGHFYTGGVTAAGFRMREPGRT
jgi:hypothetical protein